MRTHLERLEQAGLIVRHLARQPRGRPADAWTIAPDAQPGGRAPSAYQDLGCWLARVVRSRRGGLRSIEDTGRQIGHELAPADATNDADVLETILTALRFQPTVSLREDDRLTLCLRNWPYRAAVHENQPAIWALHKGITRGLLDVLHPHAKLGSFVPHDPDQAGCEIELRGIKPPTIAPLVEP